MVGKAITERVSIGSGPSGVQVMPTPVTGLPPVLLQLLNRYDIPPSWRPKAEPESRTRDRRGRVMLKRIHVNQHVIRSNAKDGACEPVFTVKTYKGNEKARVVEINGPCRLVYSPDNPLDCGAKAWIETEAEVMAR
jgi:hypothetical protein